MKGHLVMDFKSMDNAALAAALTEAREKATALFALDAPTIEQVNEAEALVAAIGAIEGEQAERAAAVKDAEKRFAAARATFSNEGDTEDDTEEDADAEGDDESEDESTEDESAEDTEADDTETEGDGGEGDGGEGDGDGGEATVTASARNAQRVRGNVARKVGAKAKRPNRQAARPVTITAAADVPGFATGSSLDGMEQVAKALMNRVKGFAPFNAQAARAINSQTGGAPALSKFGVASFGINFDASQNPLKMADEYGAVKAALKRREESIVASMAAAKSGKDADPTLTAAGWCAPSENVYSFIADYVVDGLWTVPEVNAPRGGLNITTGPERSSQGDALDDFGFTQTEAQAEAGQEKTCETIVCPDFTDHRLDAIGYCFKIPLLTQKAYPELVTDALRFANVLYAHKGNRRLINDLVALSTAVSFQGYGATFTDALEALSLIAVAERRRWNVGQNAIMEVKVPAFALEVFRADMSRRNGIAKDSVSDADIARHFADRRLAVEYGADWQEVSVESGALILPGEFDVLMYPSGTFVKAVEDVINLSAVYDAASLTINEYTGVFFEQGYMALKAGYGSSKITIPINTAGEQGALVLTGSAGGSF